MTLAPWRSPLARALHRNRSLVYARYVQLATVRPDGRPANRTVVFRGWWEETNQLRFVSDRRSEKTHQMQQQPWAEVCWYFPKSREQFRLSGLMQIGIADTPELGLEAARQQAWQDLSDNARIQFGWPHPGEGRSPTTRFEVAPLDPTLPPDTFCLLLLDPQTVDHLELRGDPQQRTHYTYQDGEWVTSNINP